MEQLPICHMANGYSLTHNILLDTKVQSSECFHFIKHSKLLFYMNIILNNHLPHNIVVGVLE